MLWFLAAGILLFFSLPGLFGWLQIHRRQGEHFQPPSTARLLSGKPIPAGMKFFFKPNDGYGEILFAESTLTDSYEPPPVGPRVLLMTLYGAMTFFAANYFVTWAELQESPWRYAIWFVATAGGVLNGLISVKLHSCFFVCERGLLEGVAWPSGNWIYKRPRHEVAYPFLGQFEESTDANGWSELRWSTDDGAPVGSLRIAKHHHQRRHDFLAAAKKGWHFSQLAWQLRMLPRCLEMNRGMGGEWFINDEVQISSDQISIEHDGMRFVFDVSDLKNPRLLEWPLPEHLAEPALRVFRRFELHQDENLRRYMRAAAEA